METILILISVLLFISIFGSLASDRLGIPALILFLLIGIIAGQSGIGKIHFESAGTARDIGVVALSFILFAGGFGTQFKTIKPILASGILLSTLGVIVSAVVMAVLLQITFHFPFLYALLLGSIVSATDAASVFSVMGSKNISLKGHLKPILEFESASNDPMSVALTLAIIALLQNPDLGAAGFFIFLLKQFVIGGILGLGIAFVSMQIIKRFIHMDYEGIYSVLTIGLILFTYGVVNAVGGSPFLAVYILGLYLGNSDILYKRNLLRYHDNISWLSQIIMFLCLGLILNPSNIPASLPQGILATLFLIFLARPASVFLSLLFVKKLSIKEKIFISWSGLRGAAPIILATFPLLANIPGSQSIFTVVFFIVVVSVLIQGPTMPMLAAFLKLNDKTRKNIRYPIEFEKSDKIEGELNELEVPENSIVDGIAVRDIKLPENLLIVLIYRNDKFFPASGKTIIYAKDRLLVLASMSGFIRFSMEILTTKPIPKENN